MFTKLLIGIYIIIWIIFILCCIILYYRNQKLKSIYGDDLDLYHLFNGIDGFIIKTHDIYNLTYGEVTPNAINNIIKYLEKINKKPDIFIDLGCGAGKSLVIAKYKGFKECHGIELVKERYDESIRLRERLDNNHKKSIYIYNNDLFNFKDIIKINPKRHYTIFISNLLFSDELNKKIWQYLNEIMPNGSIIIVSRPLTYKWYEMIDTPMSWSKISKCYTHIIKK
jgi:hypothetical protein